MPPLASVTDLLDVPLVLAGHGYDLPGAPRDDGSGAAGGDGGIGTFPIVAVAVIALVTVIMLVWLSSPATKARLNALMPFAIVFVLIVLPLIAWPMLAGSDRQGDEQILTVERATSPDGAPELLVWLADDGLNRLETTRGQRAVRLQCFRRDGQMMLDRRHRWPFVEEAGFDAPHSHQPVNPEQLRAVTRCRLRGTSLPLEGDVEGRLG